MGGPVADEIILCSLKVLYIVCYIANVPVCVLCDGRTGARTILLCPVLGVFCDARNNDANSQVVITRVPVRSYASDTYILYTVRS